MDFKKILTEVIDGLLDVVSASCRFFCGIGKRSPVLFSIAAVLLVLGIIFAVSVPFLARNRLDAKMYKLEIPEGASASRIAEILFSEGIIQSRASFKLYVGIFGDGRGLKAGSYYLSPSMTNAAIVSTLSRGRASAGDIRVTFPEGASIYRMSKILESSGIRVKGGDFSALAYRGLTRELRSKYPFLSDVPTRSLEGYLFPDTYFLAESMELSRLVEMMLDRFSEKTIPVYASSGQSKYGLHQILTLASIIEKEAEVPDERGIISSVFHNRLNIGMALQADPTVKYVLENPTVRVRFAQLETDSPYNTYRHRGLPPGPICNPGVGSVKAAVHPAGTDYLYFVSNADGTHTFSRTWEEHKKAAERFRKK